jgi:sulfatase maturation enzyme AslB (radical SAM superfamily)
MYQYASLVHWMQNPQKTIIPASVDIDLTNICNQDCFYCNTADFRRNFPVQKKHTEYLDLLDRMAGWRAHSPNSIGTLHTVTYAGAGEPTLLKGFEEVVEHSIDLGFLTSMTTNGTYLDRLVDTVSAEKLQKMGWIGVDVDAGSPDLYEQIRRTIPKESIFERVQDNVRALVDVGVNVDLKVLLCEYNTGTDALHDIFAMAKRLGVRQIYFRPVALNGTVYDIEPLISQLEQLSIDYQVKIMYNRSKFMPRNYNRCHQMFQYPIFCADGKIYVCCENTGNPQFAIGSWDDTDFRDVWLGKQHQQVYNSVNTNLCKPCGPNKHNIKIQDILNDPSLKETLYY